MFREGPVTRWEHELRSVSREGLVMMVRWLNTSIGILTGFPCDHNRMLAMVRDAKRYGRRINLGKRIEAMLADPAAEAAKWDRRRRAAKKAARRRKKGGR